MTKDNMVSSKESGATLVEYALLVALVAIAAIVAMKALSSNISQSFSSIGSAIAPN